MFFLGYDHESFSEAKSLNVMPFEDILQGIAYAGRDLAMGYISNFQIYRDNGELVFDSQKVAA